MPAAAANPLLSIVIPCLNEQAVLALLRQRLVEALERLDFRWEVVFVDDGSTDDTLDIVCRLHREDPRFKVLGLSRNFGHQAAVAAGLSYVEGDVVAVLDADLQDPPDLLETCLARWQEGYDVIFAVRRRRKEGFLKRAAYGGFYRLMRSIADIDIPADSGDFCVLDRRVVETLRKMPERNMFLRGMRAWAGFRQTGVEYDRPARAAGDSKYSFRKLARLALDGIFAFSTIPLRLATWFGLGIVGPCFLGAVFVILWRVLGFEFLGHTAHDLPGWAGGIVAVLFIGGVQLLIMGVIGEYLARIYTEVKLRPRWVVTTALGVPRCPGQAE
jgi:dolichol-phosphate mannosyltransferase